MSINPREFLNTPEELHALVHGWAEIICPFPPMRKAMSEKRSQELESEYHYYLLGRVLGILTWIPICCVIKRLFF